MANENSITIVGNLADDPELRYTPQGVAVTNLRVAVNRRFFNREQNQWDERLDGFFTVNVWRNYAENVAESLAKGSRVLVTGRLINRSFEDREGQTRWVTEIEADEVCPSLRWATASLQKVQRGGGGGGGGDRGGATPAAERQPDANLGGAPPPAASEPEDVPF